jgi:hypothetical protein
MTTPSQLPTLDSGSSLWFDQVYKATQASKTCVVPQKYFDVLSAWGFVTGTPEAAKLTSQGMSRQISTEQAAKSTARSKRK